MSRREKEGAERRSVVDGEGGGDWVDNGWFPRTENTNTPNPQGTRVGCTRTQAGNDHHNSILYKGRATFFLHYTSTFAAPDSRKIQVNEQSKAKRRKTRVKESQCYPMSATSWGSFPPPPRTLSWGCSSLLCLFDVGTGLYLPRVSF